MQLTLLARARMKYPDEFSLACLETRENMGGNPPGSVKGCCSFRFISFNV
jgi:hypothetical protein